MHVLGRTARTTGSDPAFKSYGSPEVKTYAGTLDLSDLAQDLYKTWNLGLSVGNSASREKYMMQSYLESLFSLQGKVALITCVNRFYDLHLPMLIPFTLQL